MAFFRTINFSEPLPPIAGQGVTLRAPQMTDYGDWASLREACEMTMSSTPRNSSK